MRERHVLVQTAMRLLLGAGRYVGYDRAARLAAAAARAAGAGERMSGERVRANLARFFPEGDEAWAESVTRRLRANAARAKLVDKYFLPNLPDDVLDRTCRWTGDGPMREAMREGRGVVLVSLHYGRFWAAPVWLSRHGANVLAFQVGGGGLPARERTLSGGTLEAKDLSATLRAVRALRKGAVVCIQLDAGRVERPLVVEFLGRPTRVAATAVEIARAAGAVVVPALAVVDPEDEDRVVLVAYGALDCRELPEGEPAEATMRRLLGPLEAQVRADPSQWYGLLNADRRLAEENRG